MIVKVATYNIHNADGAESLCGIAEELRSVSPDLIGIQELDQGVNRSGKLNLLSVLKNSAGYPYAHFCRTIGYDGGDYGIGILSRFPILGCEQTLLPSGEEQRIVAHFTLDFGARHLSMFNTHLSLEAGPRATQFQILSRLLSECDSYILTGDFNVAALSEFSVLGNCRMANDQSRPIDTFKTGGCIDNIIVSDDIAIRSVFLSQTQYSDHNMLVADIEL